MASEPLLLTSIPASLFKPTALQTFRRHDKYLQSITSTIYFGHLDYLITSDTPFLSGFAPFGPAFVRRAGLTQNLPVNKLITEACHRCQMETNENEAIFISGAAAGRDTHPDARLPSNRALWTSNSLSRM